MIVLEFKGNNTLCGNTLNWQLLMVLSRIIRRGGNVEISW